MDEFNRREGPANKNLRDLAPLVPTLSRMRCSPEDDSMLAFKPMPPPLPSSPVFDPGAAACAATAANSSVGCDFDAVGASAVGRLLGLVKDLASYLPFGDVLAFLLFFFLELEICRCLLSAPGFLLVLFLTGVE